MTQTYEIQTIIWQGIEIEIRYCSNWSSIVEQNYGYRLAHLEVETINPKQCQLPITETGYKSHFLATDAIVESGGAEKYVQYILNEAAQSEDWKRFDAKIRQGELF